MSHILCPCLRMAGPAPGVQASSPGCCMENALWCIARSETASGNVQGGLRRCSGSDKHVRLTFVADSVKDAKVVRTPYPPLAVKAFAAW